MRLRTLLARTLLARTLLARTLPARILPIGAALWPLLGAGCGIDAALFHKFTEDEVQQVPGAGEHTIHGQASTQGEGASVRFYTPAGVALPNFETSTGPGGSFLTKIPATNDLTNTVVRVATSTREVWGLIPRVPAKKSVLEPSLNLGLGTDVAAFEDLGLDSTLAMLVILGQRQYGEPPVALGAISPYAVVSLLNEVSTLVAVQDERVIPLRDMLARILADGASSRPALIAFPALGESFLDLSALSAGYDYDGDEQADTDTQAFDAALAEAVRALAVGAVCYPDDRIRVVMMVDFHDGNTDRNCAPIDRWQWTQDTPGRQMFIVGGLHPDTPNCDTAPAPCIDSDTFVKASAKLGNWIPNNAKMYDDGTNGDLIAGDNVWTLSLELPWFDAGSPDAAWVRIHYKYTWGTPGQLWTSTEEWPGNSRLLELRDVNGDGIIARYDLYGDETSNKDLSNLLTPGKGGCGKVEWQSEDPSPNCVNDTVENQIDTDGDCVLDSYPPPGSAAPITISCEQAAGTAP